MENVARRSPSGAITPYARTSSRSETSTLPIAIPRPADSSAPMCLKPSSRRQSPNVSTPVRLSICTNGMFSDITRASRTDTMPRCLPSKFAGLYPLYATGTSHSLSSGEMTPLSIASAARNGLSVEPAGRGATAVLTCPSALSK